MPAKRHHYLPRLLLRRFASEDGADAGWVWRADLSQSRVVRVAPKYEAAKRHYHRLPPESGLPADFAEHTIGRIESYAAAALARFEREPSLNRSDRLAVAALIALQHRRTPAGRRQLRFIDEQLIKLEAERRASDSNAVRAALEADGSLVSEADVARNQRELLEDLRSNRFGFASTPDREVAMMFVGLEETAVQLVDEFDWRFLRLPEGIGNVVLPDSGITMFDPAPRFPSAGTGFASSAEAETVLHLGPRLVLVLRPGLGYGSIQEATAENVELLNVRACASSDKCIYGASDDLVRRTVAKAMADPVRINRSRPRPPTLWLAEGEGTPGPGPVEFTGYSTAGTTVQAFDVSEEAMRQAR